MTVLSKEIRNLFYNPESDSISSLLKDIEDAHAEILKITDLSRCTLSSKSESAKSIIRGFKIPNEGLSKEHHASLIAELFHGVCRWHSPNSMYNVVTSPIIPTVTAKTFTSLYNPNLCMDTACGDSLIIEQKVIKAIAEYIGWKWQDAGGVFTWGGKATIMYGIKMGLKNCSPDSSEKGVKEDIIVLSTASGHPAHKQDVDWLGIGINNMFKIKIGNDSRVDLCEMEKVIKDKTKEGKKIAAIIISGGSTNNMVVDPIEKVVELRDRLVKELGLSYVPHVHVDAVVAFPWIFFKDYDFKLNPLGVNSIALERISEIIKYLKDLNRADSFGIDFHKMGFCPYVSCVFMVKNKKALYKNSEFWKWPFKYSIENSRPGDGPNSAYVALNVLGVTGFQNLVAYLTEMAVDLQNKLLETGDFEIINMNALGVCVIFVPCLPENIIFANQKDEANVRNNYTSYLLKRIYDSGNPYYIDEMPSNSTGANPYPLYSLKAYIMSSYSSPESNVKFVQFLVELKKDIDLKFDFADANMDLESEHPHPLK